MMSDPEGGFHLTKCHCNLQSNMRGFIWHAISLHPLSIPSILRQKICKHSKISTDIGIYTLNINREMRGNCKWYMAYNSYKINDVEKMFLGDTEVYVLQKTIFGAYQ